MSRPAPLLTSAEVAERLRTTPYTIVKACRSGELRATKPNRNWLITEEAVADYLAKNANTPQQDDAA